MAVIESFTHVSIVQLFGVALSVLIARTLYLRYFHPLSRYPGPFLASQTDFWSVKLRGAPRILLSSPSNTDEQLYRKLKNIAGGKQHIVDQKLHEKYGPIVRDGPSSLRFSDLEAYKAIYGFKNFEKTDYYILSGNPDREKFNLFQMHGEEQHRVRRKQLVVAAVSKAH